MTADTCVLPHRHEPARPRRALDGLYVCAGCRGRMEQTLAELPAQHTALAARLAASLSNGMGEKVGGSRERPLPISTTVADHREHIARTVASWAALTAEERGIGQPLHADPSTVCTWLLRHLDWACAQPWVDDYAGELLGGPDSKTGRWELGLRGKALAILYPTGRRRVDIAPCPEASAEAGACPGTLVATVAPVDDLLPGSIVCSADPDHAWAPGEWHRLGRLLGVSLHNAGVQDLAKRLAS